MKQKIAFFDIDGTLTSELDGSVPASAEYAIKKSRENGHLMFINTGRCMQNVEPRFLEIGFDGIISGCGTNIYCLENGKFTEKFYVGQTHDTAMEILKLRDKAVEVPKKMSACINIEPEEAVWLHKILYKLLGQSK